MSMHLRRSRNGCSPTSCSSSRRDLVVAPEPEVRVEAPLEACKPELVQPRGLVTGERRALEVGDRLSAPEVESGREPRLRKPDVALDERPLALDEERCELRRVELDVLDAQRVAGLLGDEPPRRQDATELRDVDVQHAAGRPRGSTAPHGLDQPVRRRRRPAPQDERQQQRTRPGPEPDRHAVEQELEGPEQPNVQPSRPENCGRRHVRPGSARGGRRSLTRRSRSRARAQMHAREDSNLRPADPRPPLYP